MRIISNNQGFTLFEALIAISVGVMLLGLVLAIYSLTIRSLASSEARAELVQNARVIIEPITRDIRQARDVATVLPANELELEDGHSPNPIQYVRYYRTGADLRRQIRRYSFPDDPDAYVPFDAEDDFGNPPEAGIVADELTGQFVNDIAFWGASVITVQLVLEKASVVHTTTTSIYARNL